MASLESVSLLAFAFTAGALTFFAPCAYPLLPGYVSYYLGRTTPAADEVASNDGATDGATPNGGTARGATPNGGTTTEESRATRYVADGFAVVVSDARAVALARAVIVGVLVSSGFFVVYGLLAGAVVTFGARLLAGISVLELVVGAFLVVLGAALALGWTAPTPTVALPERRRSAAGYVGFGMLYAAAAAGCTAPIFVGIALEALSAGAGFGLVTLAAYAAGMSVLMIGVTVATALGREALLSRLTRRMGRIHRVAGVLLLLAGLVEIYFFLFRFQGLELLGL